MFIIPLTPQDPTSSGTKRKRSSYLSNNRHLTTDPPRHSKIKTSTKNPGKKAGSKKKDPLGEERGSLVSSFDKEVISEEKRLLRNSSKQPARYAA